MKFNQKLISLRKERCLSQEELGYQFGVTKETISKWELGLLNPEIDKIMEISNFFDISLNELLEGQDINYNSDFVAGNVINDYYSSENKKTKDAKRIVIIFFLLIGFVYISTIFDFINDLVKIYDLEKNNKNESFDAANKNSNSDIENIFDKFFKSFEKNESNNESLEENYNKTQNNVEGTKFHIDAQSFNNTFEVYKGINKGIKVRSLLSKILLNNKNEELVVSVKFKGKNLATNKEIENIIIEVDTKSEYTVYFLYDSLGYINQVNINIIK